MSSQNSDDYSDRNLRIENKEIKTNAIHSNYIPPTEGQQNQAKEKTLLEIGFKTNDISGWEEIKQPPKEDLLELLNDMIKNFKKTDVTIEAFTMIYCWMLTKKPTVKRELILELFNAATFLSIKGILDQCWACLDDAVRFREDTAFMLYLEAGKYKNDLKDQIQQLMLTRILCSLLESNTIGVYSETEVLMAGVRWLHYDFSNRRKYISDVIKCVRFGLIAPWQLVELKRSTTCHEIQQIVENVDVQNMIDDGLSYVTTKYYYGNREDEFLECLKRLNLYEPVGRQWICDKSWAGHEHCLNKQIITYEKFLQYLEYIRSKGKDYWKELEFNKHGPYADYHLQVRANDTKYFDDYCKFEKIMKS
ncbi:uncharacterized protein LOC129605643 [Condylostylus longicornis]|uniref:uncharacterized protein LOC129605643 n=1 Tax=Condylostylus longicornis TaxID=2530218 RepID=UPI00244E5AAE|nr:uncharacterized protein LOC129605643 [Condylostylus longicornis]